MKLLQRLAPRSLSVVVFLALSSLLFSSPSSAASPHSSSPAAAEGTSTASPRKVFRPENGERAEKKADYEPDQILVKFKAGVSDTVKEKLHKKHGSKKLKILKTLNVHHLKLKQGVSVEEALSLYKADPNVAYAEPDYTVTAATVPNDYYYGRSGSWGQSFLDLWGLQKINCADAWSVTQGSADVVVAVSDSGIDFSHPDIQANIWTNPRTTPYDGIEDANNSFANDLHGWNWVAHNNNPVDDRGHGTLVSGIIAATGNNGIGVPGISWNTKIMPLKFVNSSGRGTSADAAATIIYAADNGAKVVNLSWGIWGRSQTIEDAINYAFNKGIVVVAVAGNDGISATSYFPAGYQNVITVAATDNDDKLASFSNFGPTVQVAAPGVDILSLRAAGTDIYYGGSHIVGGSYYRASGTSIAAPYVSGLAALLFSQNPARSNAEVMAKIVGTADDIGVSGIGSGRINAFSALTQTPTKSRITYKRHSIADQSGNGNGKLDPGENVGITVSVQNFSAPGSATVTLSSADPYVTVVSGTAALGTVASWQTADTSLAPFQVSVSPDIPKLHTVTFNVTITANDGSSPSSTTFDERVTAELPGWPVQTGTVASGPITLADVDGDGVAETLTTANMKLHVLKGDGTPLPGWPRDLPSDARNQPPVAVGDLDGNGKQVLVVPGEDNIHAWNADGTPKAGFPILVPTVPGLPGASWADFDTVTLADLDGDGTLEIIAVAYWHGKVYVWRHDGTPAPGWPISITPAEWIWSGMTSAVADLDGDGTLELIVPTVQDTVYAWHYDGTPVAGWPVSIEYPMHVASGDFAHDGTAKVIVSTEYDTLVAFNGDGSPIAGWPQQGGMAVIGDLDGDGELDIVTDISDQVFAYRIDGSLLPGWPQTHGNSLDEFPVLGDFDGDGQVDVLFRTAQRIFGWRADGSALPGFPLLVNSSDKKLWDGYLALGDVNGDGLVDVVTGSGAEDDNIYAFTLSGQYRRQNLPWPMFGHDPQKTTNLLPAPVIVHSSFSGTPGVPFSKKFGARGGYGPYLWSVGGNLPPGLALNSATGEISGTPTQAGTFQFTVQVVDPYAAGASKAVTVTIDGVAIGTTSLPAGAVLSPYSQTLSVAGGTAPYIWSVTTTGWLPSGLALDSATGVISGIPWVAGSYTVAIRVTDANGSADLRLFPLTIAAAVAPSLADFTATSVLAEVPVLVNFSDASMNAPTAWSWLFGDGSSGSGSSPSHRYTTPGTYTVSLNTMSQTGSQSVTKNAFITVLACSRGAVRLMTSNAPFAGINAAYQAAVESDVIQLLAVDNAEVIEIDRDIDVVLRGGYDCTYLTTPLGTTLTGRVRVTAGKVSPENLRLR